MSVFHPQSGVLRVEVFENPRIYPKPLLMLTMKIEFAESMDPENPDEQQKASATFDVLPLPVQDWRRLEDLVLNVSEIDEFELTEGSIYFYGYHNPADLNKAEFGKFEKNTIHAQLSGVIDFTYEGLLRLGKPTFDWGVKLKFDPETLDSAMDEFAKRTGK